MSKTLEELMASPDVGLPTVDVPVCLAGKLDAELAALDDQIEDLLEREQKNTPQPRRRGTSDNDDPDVGPVLRFGEAGNRTREVRISHAARAELDALAEQREDVRTRMADHTVLVRFAHRRDGAWRHWVNQHPPREDDARDQRAGFNRDDLAAAVRDRPRDWVTQIAGEGYTDEQWTFVWDNAVEGDHDVMLENVRVLHTYGVSAPKSLNGSWETTTPSGSLS